MFPINEQLHGTLVVEQIESQVLKGNPLGDPHRRHLPIYLPPNYHQNEQRYPLVLGLSGLFGNTLSWLSFRAFDENLVQLIDRLIVEKELPPFVLALPDCFTRFGGSQYIDSLGTGRYAEFVALESLPFLQQNYRVSAAAEDTVLAGKSSGGFGSLRLAMRWPELFGHVAVSAADLNFDMTARPEIAALPSALERHQGLQSFLTELPQLRKLDKSRAQILNIIALSTCYSPRAQAPGFDFPIDLNTGEMIQPTFAKWLEQDPAERITHHQPELDALASLKTLHIEAGDSDEYASDLGARVFASRLQKAGVPCDPISFRGGHFGTTWRWEHMLKSVWGGS
jgi:enterochelin esterase-like enzyme